MTTDESIIPLIKKILLMGPPTHVDPATRASLEVWGEPFPTIAQVQATQAVYSEFPGKFDGMVDLLKILVSNLQVMTRLGMLP